MFRRLVALDIEADYILLMKCRLEVRAAARHVNTCIKQIWPFLDKSPSQPTAISLHNSMCAKAALASATLAIILICSNQGTGSADTQLPLTGYLLKFQK